MNLHVALRRPLLRTRFLACCLMLVILDSAWWCWLHARGIDTSAENGPMETVQAGSLAFCALVFALLCVRSRHGASRWLYACLAVHCLGFFSREMDLEDFNLPVGVVLIGTGAVRYAFLGAVWLVFLGYFFSRVRACAALMGRWACASEGLCMLGAAGLYVLARPFDRWALPLDPITLEFVEELVETQATLLMLVSALLALLPGRAISEEAVGSRARTTAPPGESTIKGA